MPMRYRHLVILLLLVLPLGGCPLTGNYPLGSRDNALIDNRIIGKWEAITTKESEKGNLRIYQFNEKEYYFEAFTESDNSISRGRVFITGIDNVKFMNYQEINNYKVMDGYVYIKYEIFKENLMRWWALDIRSLPTKNLEGAELISYIKHNLNRDKLYEKLGDYNRVDKNNN